jgi:hypothetical protein
MPLHPVCQIEAVAHSILQKSHRCLSKIVDFVDVAAGPCHWFKCDPIVILGVALLILQVCRIIWLFIDILLYLFVRDAHLMYLCDWWLSFFWFCIWLKWRLFIQCKFLCDDWQFLLLNWFFIVKSCNWRVISKVRLIFCRRWSWSLHIWITLLFYFATWLLVTIINYFHLALLYVFYKILKVWFVF